MDGWGIIGQEVWLCRQNSYVPWVRGVDESVPRVYEPRGFVSAGSQDRTNETKVLYIARDMKWNGMEVTGGEVRMTGLLGACGVDGRR